MCIWSAGNALYAAAISDHYMPDALDTQGVLQAAQAYKAGTESSLMYHNTVC